MWKANLLHAGSCCMESQELSEWHRVSGHNRSQHCRHPASRLPAEARSSYTVSTAQWSAPAGITAQHTAQLQISAPVRRQQPASACPAHMRSDLPASLPCSTSGQQCWLSAAHTAPPPCCPCRPGARVQPACAGLLADSAQVLQPRGLTHP
jgi:hypothetical protein